MKSKNLIKIGDYTVRYPGKIVSKFFGKGLWLLDQLDYYEGIDVPDNSDDIKDDDGWVFVGTFTKYIKDYYNLDPIEYYGLVVMGDKTWRKKCDYSECDNDVVFYSVYKGYASYCSISCSVNDHYDDPEFVKYRNSIMNSKEHKELLSKRAHENWSNPEYCKHVSEAHIKLQNTDEWKSRTSNQMKEFWKDPVDGFKRAADIAKGSMISYCELNEIKTLYIYGCLIEEGLKIGICDLLEDRLKYIKGIYNVRDVIVYYGDYLDIINLEYEFKLSNMNSSLALKNYNYCDFNGWSEVFTYDTYDELLKFINNYKLIKKS